MRCARPVACAVIRGQATQRAGRSTGEEIEVCNETRDNAYAIYSLLMINPDPAKFPVTAVHHAFDSGYNARDAEVSRLRELLRKTLTHCDASRIEGGRGLYDAIQDELAQARQETTQ